ncbi:MAG: acyl-CoA thioesterase [Tyzzerella sp.]|uniref:Acyl-CoA thioesterase n=1 Tax=Candidatus Fimicola merdigallinarum TaxID=2840819 RepID=A0A9D9DYE6_9FIRM|nr:acyl-CoA thioesterase [Candidatus Fimicola merdigallinarum]
MSNNKTSYTDIRVRYAETDAMGVVHHANYYVYFERAREDLIESFGISYFDMENDGVMTPVVETQCKYISPARYGDTITVKTSMDKLTPVKFEISYEVYRKSDNTLLAKGKTLMAFTDKNIFSPVSLKKFRPAMWEKFNI